MTKTRKSFMKAGGIVGIVSASLLILLALTLLFSMQMINFDFVVEVLTQDGAIALFTEEEIALIVALSKFLCVIMSVFILGLSVAGLVLSILVIRQANSGSMKKGCIIALMVITLLSGNIVTSGFMITALCLKKSSIPTPAGINYDDEQFAN